MANIETDQDREDNPEPSELELQIAQYEVLKNVFLHRAEKLWRVPTKNRRYLAEQARDRLVTSYGELMLSIPRDDEYSNHEDTFKTILGMMRMCDADIVNGLNDIAGSEILLKADLEPEIPEDPEQMSVFVHQLTLALQGGVYRDFGVFCDDSHFQRIDIMKKTGKHILDVGKIAGGVTLGIAASNKLRKR